MGVLLACLAGLIARNFLCRSKSFRLLDPRRFLRLLVYVPGPWFIELIKANLDVAYRVITGKINPGIVKISPQLTTDLGITMLANSITLTPGTLSVDIDEDTNDLYVHWINVDTKALESTPVDCKYICGNFPKWVRRIAE
jgi:multicomponent Na+:H+ antiporter subunit E